MARAACNDKFQDQTGWTSGVVLEFVMFEPDLAFCSEKFWRSFEINFCFSLFRALKRQMSCGQILIKTRHLACEINFKIKLD
ncbi:MAG: hypothetical protein KIC71_05065 [Campylobacter concisus]|nr:hypothetical protein [Campylobacter concisus]